MKIETISKNLKDFIIDEEKSLNELARISIKTKKELEKLQKHKNKIIELEKENFWKMYDQHNKDILSTLIEFLEKDMPSNVHLNLIKAIIKEISSRN